MSSVQAGSFLTLHYRLSAQDGADLVNTFGGKPATLTIGAGQLSQALEQRLLGLREGSHDSFELAPGEAFGPRSDARVQWVARKLLDQLDAQRRDYRAGDVVQFPTPDGSGRFAGAVRQVGTSPDEVGADGQANGDGSVQFDFNHPLAGLALRFEVQLIGIL
jgi:FKBP-type peptidyl-prolyl cis-trans isomerase SlpA